MQLSMVKFLCEPKYSVQSLLVKQWVVDELGSRSQVFTAVRRHLAIPDFRLLFLLKQSADAHSEDQEVIITRANFRSNL